MTAARIVQFLESPSADMILSVASMLPVVWSQGCSVFHEQADESTATQPTMTWIIACSSLVSTPPRPLRDGRSGTLGVRIGVR